MKTALGSLSTAARRWYAPIFAQVADLMPAAIGAISNPEPSSLHDDIAEYVVRRVVGGVRRPSFIYLVKDGYGIWRVDSL
jgi:hypothetical protein